MLGCDISQDGLHFLGDFNYDQENGTWDRAIGDEEEQWRRICLKHRGLVVITKDLPEDSWDLRVDHARKNYFEQPTPNNQTFYRNLRRWMYGLMNIDVYGNMPELPSTSEAQNNFENKPWVRINLKKEPGGSSISDAILDEYIEKCNSLLKEQLLIYRDASIYLDCAHGRGLKLLKEIYPDIKPFRGEDDWIFYSSENSFFIINSYHPSYPIKQDYYYWMKDDVFKFFQEVHIFNN